MKIINKKKRMKKMLCTVLLLVLPVMLSSCGSVSKSSAAGAADTAAAGYAPAAAEAAEDYVTEEAEEAYGMENAAEAVYDAEAEQDDFYGQTTEYDDEYTEEDEAAGAEPSDETGGRNLEKIVYTCSADLQTLEYDKSVKELKEAVRKSGGIIQSETESNNNYSWYYDSAEQADDNRNLYLTVRIPTEKYEEFVSSLDQYGQVMNKSQSAENISRTYNDKKTYIASLETEQKRLLEMMDKAETIEDMMAVEERLTEVQRQLNQYKTELDAMDMDIAYSTVTLTLQEVQKITDRPAAGDSFGTRIRKAFINAWAGFVTFWEDFLFALIYLLPAMIVTAVIVLIVLRATRSRRRARRERKRAEKEMPAKEENDSVK